MEIELEEVVRRLKKSARRTRRSRRSVEEWRDLNHLDNEGVVEIVSAAYQDAADKVYSFVADLPENEQQDILLELAPLFNGYRTRNNITPLEPVVQHSYECMVEEPMATYNLISNQAFDRFYEAAKDGSPGPLLGLMSSMQDPRLAGKLLSKFNPVKPVFQQYAEQTWRNRLRSQCLADETGTVRALSVYIKTRTGAGRNKVFKEEIAQPLLNIWQQPPIALQLLYKSLNQLPTNA